MRSFVMMNIISKIFRQDFQYGTDATSKHFKNSREPDFGIRPTHRPRPQQGAPAADNRNCIFK